MMMFGCQDVSVCYVLSHHMLSLCSEILVNSCSHVSSLNCIRVVRQTNSELIGSCIPFNMTLSLYFWLICFKIHEDLLAASELISFWDLIRTFIWLIPHTKFPTNVKVYTECINMPLSCVAWVLMKHGYINSFIIIVGSCTFSHKCSVINSCLTGFAV